jgi:hypothetical protein
VFVSDDIWTRVTIRGEFMFINNRVVIAHLLPMLVAGLWTAAANACASCGCTLSDDAAGGFAPTPGFRFSLQFDNIDQTALRSGTHSTTAAQVVDQPANPAIGGGEIEHETLNRYITLGVGYGINKDWRLDLKVPYIDRDHTTYGQQNAPYTPSESAPDQLSYGHVAGLGDIKLITTYQGLLPTRNLGLQLGIKLPTDAHGTAVNFSSGPAAGTPIDASLQAGTGSTDLIVGTYYYQAISQNLDVFASAQFEAAIRERLHTSGNDYRPGNSQTMSLGIRYLEDAKFIPEVQVNLLHKSADQGALADTSNTAGTIAYVSPGIMLHITHRLQGYGFIQLPVYSQVSGYQLFPRWTASVGLSVSY